MTTYHLITATLLIEQREQGDQLVARREAEIALWQTCAAITAAGRRRAIVRATVLESLRIIEEDINDAQKGQHANEFDYRRRLDGDHQRDPDRDHAARPADARVV